MHPNHSFVLRRRYPVPGILGGWILGSAAHGSGGGGGEHREIVGPHRGRAHPTSTRQACEGWCAAQGEGGTTPIGQHALHTPTAAVDVTALQLCSNT